MKGFLESRWLIDRLHRERMVRETHARHTLWEALKHPRVLSLGLVYFGTAAASYGLGFWLPTIVKEFGVSDLQTGFITAIPYAVGVAAVVIWPLLSDRMQERKWNTALAFLVAAVGLALSTYFPDPVLKITTLCIAAVGMFAIAPLFWTLPRVPVQSADELVWGAGAARGRSADGTREGAGVRDWGYSGEEPPRVAGRWRRLAPESCGSKAAGQMSQKGGKPTLAPIPPSARPLTSRPLSVNHIHALPYPQRETAPLMGGFSFGHPPTLTRGTDGSDGLCGIEGGGGGGFGGVGGGREEGR